MTETGINEKEKDVQADPCIRIKSIQERERERERKRE